MAVTNETGYQCRIYDQEFDPSLEQPTFRAGTYIHCHEPDAYSKMRENEMIAHPTYYATMSACVEHGRRWEDLEGYELIEEVHTQFTKYRENLAEIGRICSERQFDPCCEKSTVDALGKQIHSHISLSNLIQMNGEGYVEDYSLDSILEGIDHCIESCETQALNEMDDNKIKLYEKMTKEDKDFRSLILQIVVNRLSQSKRQSDSS